MMARDSILGKGVYPFRRMTLFAPPKTVATNQQCALRLERFRKRIRTGLQPAAGDLTGLTGDGSHITISPCRLPLTGQAGSLCPSRFAIGFT